MAMFGPQTKNLTEPLTGPFEPESVDVSVTDWLMTTELLLTVVSKVAGIGRIEAAASERSWFPPLPSSEIRRMWYGEPGIAPALLPRPQSICEPTWPPQASTTVAFEAVNLIVTLCWPLASEAPP